MPVKKESKHQQVCFQTGIEVKRVGKIDWRFIISFKNTICGKEEKLNAELSVNWTCIM